MQNTKNTNLNNNNKPKKIIIMNQATLNTDQRLYLVKINWLGTKGKFIFSNGIQLVNILKEGDNEAKGIEYIKTFDPTLNKDRFVKIPKQDFLKFINWETEAVEYLKTIAYFKK